MPLYEYTCRHCDHAFEVLHRAGQSQAGSYNAPYTAQAQHYDSDSGLPPIDESKRRLRDRVRYGPAIIAGLSLG